MEISTENNVIFFLDMCVCLYICATFMLWYAYFCCFYVGRIYNLDWMLFYVILISFATQLRDVLLNKNTRKVKDLLWK